MSLDHAKAFLRELARNEALMQKLRSCTTADERNICARESGFEFTAEEFQDARSELFDEEFSDISGGGTCCGHTCEQDCSCDISGCEVDAVVE